MTWLKPVNKVAAVILMEFLASGWSGRILADDQSAPDDEQAIARFESLIKEGKYADASVPLDRYLASHPQSWRALYQLGYVSFRLHRTQESLALISKCLEIHDGFAEAHKILAFDLNILGHKDIAINELQKAIALEPACSECRYELGRIYYEEGSYVNAVEQLEQAQTLNPKAVNVYHNLGLAYSAVGENAKAVQSFEEGLRLNDQQPHPSAWPLIDYASYFNSLSDYEHAKDLLLRAISIDNRWDQAFDELSKAYRGLGQAQLAIQSLRHAVEINPRRAEYHYALARLYSQTHQSVEAKQELEEYQKDRGKSSASN